VATVIVVIWWVIWSLVAVMGCVRKGERGSDVVPAVVRSWVEVSWKRKR
jgi:hypothetical protein